MLHLTRKPEEPELT